MADSQPHSRSNTPGLALPMKRTLEEDHAPAVSSPLNPNPEPAARSRNRPPPREQREKRDTLKKREASAQTQTRANTPNPKVQKKEIPQADHPMRYAIPEPKPSDYEPPKDCIFASHEAEPFLTPDGQRELRKPVDHAWNKKGYRYTHCVADSQFRHKQFYRQSEVRPYGARMSYEDTDKWFYFDDSATIVSNEKGWRMGRGNVVAREGRMYYEVRILKGIPKEGPKNPVDPRTEAPIPGPRIRMGWARREAPLDAPVGFDSYSYGISDTRFEALHRSRASKLFKPLPKGTKNAKHMKARPPHGKSMAVEYITDQEVCEGDVIGLEIKLPSLSLHRKVVEGIYNPAVDLGDGFDVQTQDQWDQEKPFDIIRDRIPVPYKGNFYFEQLDFTTSKAADGYHERIPVPKVNPSPNHDEVSLRSLPYSHIKVYKNGEEVGIAIEDLLAFLPPASQPSAEAIKTGARIGYDDGMVGYFPAVSAYQGGIAQVNFGPDFWCPPAEWARQRENDNDMVDGGSAQVQVPEGRKLRAIGDRYKEQIAEDVLWDIIDEVDFFSQDGGFEYKGESLDHAVGKSTPKARGFNNPDENLGVEVGRRY